MEEQWRVTHVERQHLHRGVVELVPWVLNVPTAEEVSATRTGGEEKRRGEKRRRDDSQSLNRNYLHHVK